MIGGGEYKFVLEDANRVVVAVAADDPPKFHAPMSSFTKNRAREASVVAKKLLPAALAPILDPSGRHPPIQASLAKTMEQIAEKTQ